MEILFSGWYRDCKLIPYTTDADFAMFARDYDIRIKNKFLGNPNVSLWMQYGLVNDSYEFRLENDYFYYDIFFTYEYNSTHMFSGYHVYGQKWR
jgi:hypothetical protein